MRESAGEGNVSPNDVRSPLRNGSARLMSSADNSRPANMATSRLRHAAWVALLVEVIAITWFATFGSIQQMQVQSFLMLGDKSAHILAFLAAGLTASLAARSIVWPVLALSGMAGIVEVMQIFVPGRSASTFDFVASLVGVSVGLAFGAMLCPILLRGRSRARTF